MKALAWTILSAGLVAGPVLSDIAEAQPTRTALGTTNEGREAGTFRDDGERFDAAARSAEAVETAEAGGEGPVREACHRPVGWGYDDRTYGGYDDRYDASYYGSSHGSFYGSVEYRDHGDRGYGYQDYGYRDCPSRRCGYRPRPVVYPVRPVPVPVPVVPVRPICPPHGAGYHPTYPVSYPAGGSGGSFHFQFQQR